MKQYPFSLCALLLAVSCGKAPTPTPSVPPRPVNLVSATAEAPRLTYAASGRIKAAQRAELSFDRGDVLAELPAVQGQPVKQGDVLARLDTRNLELLEKTRIARHEETRRQYERMQRLFDRQAIAESDLEKARTAFEAAESDLLQVRKDLDGAVLRAPFDGYIASTFVDRFQQVQAKQPILVVHDLSRFDLEINIPERIVLAIGRTTNSQIAARFEHLPGQAFAATVKDYATEADAQTLTYAAVFSIDSPEGTVLLPGMSATLEMTADYALEEGSSCWVPQSAIFSADGHGSFAWRVDPATMKVERRALSIGPARDGLVRVLDGLAPGDQLAASGLFTLEEGQVVRPYEPAGAN